MISIYCKQRRKLDRLQKVAEKDIQKFNLKKKQRCREKKIITTGHANKHTSAVFLSSY
jgi:ribosomal silencing factor RsfS